MKFAKFAKFGGSVLARHTESMLSASSSSTLSSIYNRLHFSRHASTSFGFPKSSADYSKSYILHHSQVSLRYCCNAFCCPSNAVNNFRIISSSRASMHLQGYPLVSTEPDHSVHTTSAGDSQQNKDNAWFSAPRDLYNYLEDTFDRFIKCGKSSIARYMAHWNLNHYTKFKSPLMREIAP